MRTTSVALAALSAGSAMAQSICDKYTTALLTNNTGANQFTLVTLLVKTAALGNFTGPGSANPNLPGSMVTVPGILANGTVDGTEVSLLKYFDGTVASTNRNGQAVSVNFLDGGNTSDLIANPTTAIGADGSNQATLFLHLVQYFGVLLGCSEYGMDGFSSYGGSNSQYSVHKYMDLSEAEFTYFNTQVGLAASSFGASDEDVMAVGSALNTGFGSRCAMPATVVPDTDAENQVICQGPTCPLASPAASGCSGDAAVAGYTPVEAATVTATMSGASSMSMSGASSMSMSGASSMSMSGSAAASMTSGTGAVASATSSAAGAATSSPSAAPANAAPRQTAAAGMLLAAGGAAAAIFL